MNAWWDFSFALLLRTTEQTYEQLEQEFQEFCKIQEKEPPKFCKIFSETHEEWNNVFNTSYSEQKYSNLFDKGYGNLMDKSEISENYKTDEKNGPKNQFACQIIEFKEPEYLPNTLINFPLDNKKITDFTETSGELKMSDYKLTFSQLENNKEEVEERDYPKENITYNPNLI